MNNKGSKRACITEAVLCYTGLLLTLIFASCNEKSDIPFPNEGYQRHVIASKQLESNEICYHYNINKIQAELDIQSRNNSFILESVQILDDTTSNIPLSLKIVILDTENETSITKYLFGAFIEKEVLADSIYYFVGEAIASGNYRFTSINSNGNNVLTTVKNGIIDKTEDLGEYLPPGNGYGRTIVCVSRNCISSCDLVSHGYMLTCTPCNPDPEAGDNYFCRKEDKYPPCLTSSIIIALL